MKKLTMFFVFCLVVVVAGFGQIVPTAGIVYVKQGGTGNGSSWATATGDLHGAIMAAGVNQVWVAEGTYFPTWQWDITDNRALSFRLKNGVTLYGGFASSGSPTFGDRNPEMYLSILSGDINTVSSLNDNCYHVIYHETTMMIDSTAVINGFTIRDGNADGIAGNNNRGGGMCNDEATPNIFKCRFVSNHALRGGGIYNIKCSPSITTTDFIQNAALETGGAILNSLNSSPVIHACRFVSNSAADNGGALANIDSCHAVVRYCYFESNLTDEYGGAVVNSGFSNPVFFNCRFKGNQSGNYGGAVLNTNSHPDFYNCIFTANTATSAGGAMLNDAGSMPSVINCTVYGNTAPMAGGIANNSSNPSIVNSIIWSCGTAIANISSSPVVRYSCIEGGYSGTGNISVNPLLEGTSNTDFRPTAGSPVINAGINDSVPAWVSTDYDNFQRIVNSTVDMGAYEFRGIIFVNASAMGNNNGASWANAFVSLEDAIAVASAGNQIWVAQGTYTPSDAHGLGATDYYYHFQLKPGVKMFGSFSGWENFLSDRQNTAFTSILDGLHASSHRSYHVLIADAGCDTSTCLDGFFVTNGSAWGAGDFGYGGGILIKNASATINNCYFEFDAASEGGVIALFNSNSIVSNCYFYHGYSAYTGGMMLISGGSSRIEFCTFDSGESDNHGGALYLLNNAMPVVYGCSFFNNFTTDGYGGAVYAVSGSPVFVSCSFHDNLSTLGGGAIFTSDDLTLLNTTIINNEHNIAAAGTGLFISGMPTVTLQNCIIYDNLPAANLSVEKGSSNLNISYSDIEGCSGSGASWITGFGTDLGGNIDADPMLTLYSNAGPALGSPCLDTGDDSPYLTGMAQEFLSDNDGRARIRGPHVDMGSVELPYCKLRVDIEPAGAVSAGAQWSIDNGTTWLDSGDSLWLTIGTANITYNTVASYTSPADTMVPYEYENDITCTVYYVLIESLDESQTSDIKIYPNPATNNIVVNPLEMTFPQQVQIFCTSGNQVLSFEINGPETIDISALQPGVYYLRIAEFVQQIIKQ